MKNDKRTESESEIICPHCLKVDPIATDNIPYIKSWYECPHCHKDYYVNQKIIYSTKVYQILNCNFGDIDE